MIIVAHRGNRFGRKPELENSPQYIMEAINAGFHVEVDVWYDETTGLLYLGHDNPQYQVSVDFLKNEKMWCHAKNPQALNFMIEHDIHCFWHQEDRYTITSKGNLWCYPKNYSRNGITVDFNLEVSIIHTDCMGICTDIAEKWKQSILNRKKNVLTES